MIKFVLAEIQCAVVTSSTFIFKTGWVVWTLRIDRQFSIFGVSLQPENKRKFLVVLTLNNIDQLLNSLWINLDSLMRPDRVEWVNFQNFRNTAVLVHGFIRTAEASLNHWRI